AGKNETVSWRYDAIERLIEKAATAASPEDLGVIGYEGVTHRLVDAGSAITRDASGLASHAAGFDLGYDSRNRIVDVKKDGEDVARYFYSGSGTRVLRVVGTAIELTPFPGYVVRDGIGRLRVTLDGAPIFEEESASAATAMYPDGNDDGAITAADAWLARQEIVSSTMLRSAARRMLFADGDDDDTTARAFLHTDATSSTVAVTDAVGAVKERLSYRPYGAVFATSAGQTEYASFVNHDIDRETGFIDFGIRSLDPRLGAFLTPDPAGIVVDDDAAVVNVATPYNYARNNPLLLTDEGGADPSPMWGKVAVAFRLVGAAAVIGGAVVAGSALSAGSMGIFNLVGAVVGGAVGFGAELASQRSMAARLRASGANEPRLAIRVTKLAWATFKGVVAGSLSFGLSAASDALNGGINVLDNRTQGKHPKLARAARIAVAAASAVTAGVLYSVDDKTFGSYGEYESAGLGVDTTGSTVEVAATLAEAVTTKQSSRWKANVKKAGRTTLKGVRAVGRGLKTVGGGILSVAKKLKPR
ncbi:MAG TPA: RHS repeat-associated core domain-containing protein, partial [Myxococcota bacterium]